MTRFLSIDYGLKRIGLAVTDPLGFTVQPLRVINRKSINNAVEQILAIVKEKNITNIVVGLPLNMNGTPGILTKEIRNFASKLSKKAELPVELCDERLTTYEAERMLIDNIGIKSKKRKKVRDQLAACIILQTYLDKQKK